MINLADKNYVRKLKGNLHQLFETPAGQEAMEFLEESCGWYQSIFDPSNRDLTLINDGKRQVIATIKTIMRLSPDEIVKLFRNKEEL